MAGRAKSKSPRPQLSVRASFSTLTKYHHFASGWVDVSAHPFVFIAFLANLYSNPTNSMYRVLLGLMLLTLGTVPLGAQVRVDSMSIHDLLLDSDTIDRDITYTSLGVPIVHLQAAEISAPLRLKNPVGTAQLRLLPRLSEGGSVAETLQRQTSLFVKSYGSGTLATPSLRGTAASHTALLWNGLPLQSTMNGLSDLTLLPSVFFDAITVQPGGSSALAGSGAIGGTILLGQLLPLDYTQGRSAEIGVRAAAFGEYEVQGQVRITRKSWATSTRLVYRRADNDFRYRNYGVAGSPMVRQQGAFGEQQGLLQEVGYRDARLGDFTARLWAQRSERELPPSITEADNDARQQDYVYRATLHWERTTARQHRWQARAAWFDETIDFQQVGIDAHNRARTQITEVEWSPYSTTARQYTLGLHNTFGTAFADGYGGDIQRNHSAAFGDARWTDGKHAMQLNVRQSVTEGAIDPIVFTGAWQYAAGAWLVRARAGRNYSLPTFNDLYWQPTGNPDLLPESAWTAEAGLDWERTRQHTTTRFSVTPFYHHISNRILWSPDELGLWRPTNLQQTYGYGAALSGEADIRLSRLGAYDLVGRLSGSYDYTVSRVGSSRREGDPALGKQLIYTPLHTAQARASLTWHDWSAFYRQSLVSCRYTTTDNQQYLPGYTLGELGVGYTRSRWQVSVRMDNLWGAEYEVIAFRPMPRLRWELGVFYRVGS